MNERKEVSYDVWKLLNQEMVDCWYEMDWETHGAERYVENWKDCKDYCVLEDGE